MKYYEFRYKSKFTKVIVQIIDILTALLGPSLTVGFTILVLDVNGLTAHWPTELYIVLLGIATISGIIFAVKYCTALKGVILYSDHLSIDRYAINDFHLKPNIKIYYKDIKCIYNSREIIRQYSWKARKAVVSGGDKKYFIELTLNGGKNLYFPVENQEEFYGELLERVNEYREKNGLDKL